MSHLPLFISVFRGKKKLPRDKIANWVVPKHWISEVDISKLRSTHDALHLRLQHPEAEMSALT
jgi:hypothetical protein